MFAVATLLTVVFSLSLVGSRAGWPMTSEANSQLIEPQIYAADFRQLDFFPVWSSSDAFGLGTPLLLYYHKLFAFISGGIYLVLGNIKVTVVLSLALFMIVGAYGMRMALSTLTKRRLLLMVGSLALILTNYAFDIWLVGGDFAAFSAMMLFPWLLWWCLNLITVRQWSFALIPIMLLLILAHIASAFLSIITLFIALAVFVAQGGFNGFNKIVRRLVISALCIALPLLPLLVATLRFGRLFDPESKITQHGLKASQNFLAISQLFYDRHAYSPAHIRTSPKIEFGIWVPIALAVVLFIGVTVFMRRRPSVGKYFHVPAMVFLLVSVAAYMFLQFSVSKPIYESIRPLEDIQFPGRVVALVTSLGIVAVIAMIEGVYRKIRSSSALAALPVLWFMSFLLLSPVFSTFRNYPFMPPSQIVAPKYLRYGQFPLMIGQIGEYLPQVRLQTSRETLKRYNSLFLHHQEAQALSVTRHKARGPSAAKCTVTEPDTTTFEALQVRMTVTCDQATELALPISRNNYTTISTIQSDGRSHPVARIRTVNDPRIVIWVPSSRSEVLVVNLPTFWRVLS